MRISYLLKRIKCFLYGHKIVHGEIRNYELSYCRKCGLTVNEMIELNTLPCILNCIYGWFVERNWLWFDSFDLWIMEKFGNRLPEWWNY